ncbi:MAG: DUF1634 domain-containing protein [Phycisphaerales bacterium]|nr:DUF1634 domain-containing protein [Phycisphaerales bacterium]
MNLPDPAFHRVDRAIVWLGLSLCVALFALSVFIDLAGPSAGMTVESIAGEPPGMRSIESALHDSLEGVPLAIALSACIALVLIPMARVTAATMYLAFRREWIMALIAAAIVAILVTTFVLDLVVPDFPHMHPTTTPL